MPRTSAGLLPCRRADGGVLVFIARMGGPLWARRPRAWTVVKGEHLPDEEPLAAAEREFLEEIGVPAPTGDRLDLGEIRQSGGKLVRAWAVAAAAELALGEPGTFEMEWPPRSGRVQTFPEVSAAEWVDLDGARERVVAAQVAFLDRLAERLTDPG